MDKLTEIEKYQDLYSESDKEIMKNAEDSLDPHLNRIDELIEYAKQSKMKRIGIANCISFSKETELLSQKLKNEGFEVYSANCKIGKLPFNKLVENYKGVSCNPAGQALHLSRENTELNIVLGLCVGHDMIFSKQSKSPSTTLIIKDRKYKKQFTSIFNDEINS